MERSQVLDAMGQLKLYGMKAAYDEILATVVKRRHEPPKIVHCPAGDREAIRREGATCLSPRSARSRNARSNTR